MIDLETPLKGKGLKIVFTEGKDLRMMKAAERLRDKKLLVPVLYGNRTELEKLADSHHICLDGMMILDPDEFQDHEAMENRMLELRKGKDGIRSYS